MKSVAKLVIIDGSDRYLVLHRDNHPLFGNDPDLPGGTAESGESMTATVLREVQEETGIALEASQVKEVCTSTAYSEHGTSYTLFIAKLSKRPEVTLSWEHAKHEWIDRDIFLATARNAADTYMHMVYDALSSQSVE